ncbi:MAG: hypothetical protein MJZ05_04425 [Fibrobacter sp.]|nr:hypothetical protein [Fibrobacter sp.]
MVTSHKEDGKRLAKNTLALYFRTIIVMFVALFISRVLLKNLGVEDFGVYNVVGSIVVLFSFFNTTMTASSQRFITFELGKGNIKKANDVFCSAIAVQLVLAVVVIIAVEIVGLWFLNNKLNVPADRMHAANCAFQFSILTFCTGMLRVPFEASVIANEKMSFFAYASIFDSIIKLAIAISLGYNNSDRLILYAMLLFLGNVVIFAVYIFYCKRRLNTCQLYFSLNKGLYKELLAFGSWNLLGSTTNVATQKGLIFLFNIFYGVTVNAAYGIASQVNSAVISFVGSFQTSYRPQIVKSYAQGDYAYLKTLVTRTSKMSFALMIIPTSILIFNMSFFLKVWLSNVPNYAVDFCQVILLCAIVDALTGPYNAAIIATGKIKHYEICICFSYILDLIVSFCLVKVGLPPYLVLVSRFVTRGILNMFIGLFFLNSLIHFNVFNYVKTTVIPTILIIVIAFSIPSYFYSKMENITMFIFSSLYFIVVLFPLLYFILFDKQERDLVKNIMRKIKK